MRFQLSTIALLLLTSAANAGSGFTEWVECRDSKTGVQSNGTGFVGAVDGDFAYVVTCEHVVRGCDSFTFGRNPKLKAELVASNAPDDVAILRVSYMAKHEPCAWGDAVYGVGDVYGYPMMADDIHNSGGMVMPNSVMETEEQEVDGVRYIVWQGERRAIYTTCHRGMSGGMVHQNDKCVGMLATSDEKNPISYFTQASRIRVHLTQCISGQCRQSYTYRQRYLYRPAISIVPPAIVPGGFGVTPAPIVQTEPTPAPVLGNPPQPSPPAVDEHRRLQSMIESNAQAITTLTETMSAIASREPQPGPPGPPGINGTNGKDATQAQVNAAVAEYLKEHPPAVTVIVKDNDSVVAHHKGVEAGSVVTVPIERTTVSK